MSFVKVASGLDPAPILLALQRHPELWNSNRVRTAHHQSAHHDLDDIVLRYSPFDADAEGADYVDEVCASIHVECQDPWFALTPARELALALMARVQGTHLGRVMISRLKAGAMIPWHSDLIDEATRRFPKRLQPAVYYSRYQLPLACDDATFFMDEEETVVMRPGEVWCFDNTKLHAVQNGSVERIAMIVDIHHD